MLIGNTRFGAVPAHRLAGAALLVTAVLMAGCASNDPAPKASVDRDQPLALFLGAEYALIDYAQLRLQNQCLAKAGFPQNLDTMQSAPRNTFESLVVTPRTFGPTTEQEARRIGFGVDLPPEPAPVVSTDPNFNRAMDTCAEQAWKQVGDNDQKVYFAYDDLGNKLMGALIPTVNSRLDPQLPAKLLTCITAKGYHPEDEQAFLKAPNPRKLGVETGTVAEAPGDEWQPKRIPGTVEVGPAIPARRYQASPTEGELAVAWLQCRQQTGMTQQQVARATEVGNELVKKYETTFDELNPQIKRLAKHAGDLIGKR